VRSESEIICKVARATSENCDFVFYIKCSKNLVYCNVNSENIQQKHGFEMNQIVPNRKEHDPRMHSVEHILNQTMVRMFHCGRAFSAHIEKKKSKCDYHFERNLTEEEILTIECKVNEIIQSDFPIYEQILSREEAGKVVSLSKLPEHAGETVRIIFIGEYDACPCSGMHASTTKEIGEFRIISSDWANGILRIRFKIQQT
jgi:misacylated tRNA(Ala) deacylase